MQPRKAIPLFTDKFSAIARFIPSKLGDPDTPPLLLYILSRDFSFFSIIFSFTGNRSSNLGRTKSREVLFFPDFFPDFSGLLFNHTFGKTLRGNSTHSFELLPCEEFQVEFKYLSFAKYRTLKGLFVSCYLQSGGGDSVV